MLLNNLLNFKIQHKCCLNYINIILFYNLIVSICFLNNNNDKILTFLKLKINKLL